MTDARTWLDRVDARTNAATDGPWRIDRWEDFYGKEVTYSVTGDTSVADRVEDNRDAEFITAARTDLPAATAALRAVLDLCDTKGFGQVLFPDDIRTAITTALEDA